MEHFTVFFYLFCCIVGTTTVLLYIIFYLKFREALLKYYAAFLGILVLNIIINMIGTYVGSLHLPIEAPLNTYTFCLHFIWLALLFFYVPRLYNSLGGQPFPLLLKIITGAISLGYLFKMTLPFLIGRDPRSTYLLLRQMLDSPFDYLMIITLICYVAFSLFLHYPNITHIVAKKISRIMIIMKIALIPGVIVSFLFYKYGPNTIWRYLALPNIFNFFLLLWNLVNIYIFFRHFQEDTEWQKTSSQWEPKADKLEEYNISRREKEIIWYLISGKTNRQIGEILFISPRTVEKHATNIYEKLDVANREALAAFIQEKIKSTHSTSTILNPLKKFQK